MQSVRPKLRPSSLALDIGQPIAARQACQDSLLLLVCKDVWNVLHCEWPQLPLFNVCVEQAESSDITFEIATFTGWRAHCTSMQNMQASPIQLTML